MDTLSLLLGWEFFYSCDGGVSFIMSLHSKQICVEWVFNTHFSQTDNDKVPLSRRVIITFTFLFSFDFLKVLIKRERIFGQLSVFDDVYLLMNINYLE